MTTLSSPANGRGSSNGHLPSTAQMPSTVPYSVPAGTAPQVPAPRASSKPRVPATRRIAVGLAVLGGARTDGLAAVPGATGRYIGMAAMLTCTSVVAAISAATALSIALHAQLWVAIVLGIFWGALIFNLDRLLLVTLSKNDPPRVKVAGFACRVFLAACLSVAISTPVTLIMFQREVNQELGVMHAAQISAYQARQEGFQQGLQLAADKKQLTRDQNQLNTGNFTDQAGSAKVTADEQAENTAYRYYLQQTNKVEGEVEGTSGTRRPGCGPVCAVESNGVTQAWNLYSAAEAQTARDKAAVATYEQQEKAQVQDQASTLTSEINAIQQSQATSLASYEKTVAGDDGLLARIEALWALGDAQPTARITHFFVFLIFFIVELLPILMKSFQLFGPKTKYEEVVDSIDDTSLTLHNERTDVVTETARTQKAVQMEAARILNEQIIEAQKQVFQAHLAEWIRNALPGQSNPPNIP
jgi:Domain of unknown function (DUF4407)